jgi:phage tail-like protein
MADERRDPLPVFCFKVEIAGVEGAAFFKSVSGLKYELETLPIREGGNNVTTYQLVGAAKWSNIILKTGYTAASAKTGLLAWRNEWVTKPRQAHRRSGRITILNTALQKQTSWKWSRGLPVKWEISEFDASKSELAIETIEIAHEGLEVES